MEFVVKQSICIVVFYQNWRAVFVLSSKNVVLFECIVVFVGDSINSMCNTIDQIVMNKSYSTTNNMQHENVTKCQPSRIAWNWTTHRYSKHSTHHVCVTSQQCWLKKNNNLWTWRAQQLLFSESKLLGSVYWKSIKIAGDNQSHYSAFNEVLLAWCFRLCREMCCSLINNKHDV